jgi:hypothetical protein
MTHRSLPVSILDVTAAPHPRFPVQGGLLLATGDALIHSSMMVTMSFDGNDVFQCSCTQQHHLPVVLLEQRETPCSTSAKACISTNFLFA